jgi:hypothetical protein
MWWCCNVVRGCTFVGRECNLEEEKEKEKGRGLGRKNKGLRDFTVTTPSKLSSPRPL